MILLAIDPGPQQSAMVIYDVASGLPTGSITLDNGDLIERVADSHAVGASHLAIEMIASYGKPVGVETFETCVWIGRFLDRGKQAGLRVDRVFRLEVKKHVCNAGDAKDPHIRQALIDRFGGPAALVKAKRCTRKKHGPNPVHGDCGCGGTGRIGFDGVLASVNGDEWAALGVAVTYADKKLSTIPFHP